MPKFPWTWELCSLLGVFASFIALIVLLSVFDKRTVFEWHKITLNTVVSTISIVLRAFLLYPIAECIGQWKWILFDRSARSLMDFERLDQASRGPLGSLRLLWQRNVPWALRMGLAVTVLSLAIDSFSQQLVQLEPNTKYVRSLDGSEALSSRAYEYRQGKYTQLVRPELALAHPNEPWVKAKPDLAMQVAIMNGLSQTKESIYRQTNVTCPAGNCTWDPFETLGVCHRCNDLTSDLTRLDDFEAAFISINNIPALELYLSGSARRTDKVTAFALPNGHFIANTNACNIKQFGVDELCLVGYDKPWGKRAISYRSSPAYLMTTYGTGNPNKTNSMQDIDTLIWSMSAIYLDPPEEKDVGSSKRSSASEDDPNIWPNIPTRATECALYYCVKNVENSVTGNVLKERTTEVKDAVRLASSWQIATIYNKGNLRPNATAVSQNPSDIEFDAQNVIEMSDLILQHSTKSGKQEFNLASASVMSISAYFLDNLRKPLKDEARLLKAVRKRLPKARVLLNGYMQSTDSEPKLLEGMWRNNQSYVDEQFEILAISMTNAIRNHGAEGVKLDQNMEEYKIPGSRDPQTGWIRIPITRYKTEWYWITMHGVVLSLGVLFCVLTMFSSRRGMREEWIWRNHSLAAMRQGALTGQALRAASTVGHMEETAMREVMKMPQGEKGPLMEEEEESERRSRSLSR